ncbi:hypothetical protein [Niveibacterium terrae]|uniref:hypothetical protein n=1 Tax=Niveibacterium terrae TaxID=3373598 RepID=UPI003A8F3638
MKSFIARLFGAGARLSALEKIILDCVENHLDARLRQSWNRQIQAINKIQRLPEGVEANFYRMKSGRSSFDEDLAFPNKTTELLVAKVQVELSGMGRLNAKVWCVKGFVFSIEYGGSVSYFEEATGMDPLPEFRLTCELMADLAA